MVVPPQDSAALADAICKLADNVTIRLELGERARAYAEANFERESILERIFGATEDEAVAIVDDAVA